MICVASFREINDNVNTPGPSQRQSQPPLQSNLLPVQSSVLISLLKKQGYQRGLLHLPLRIANLIAKSASIQNRRSLKISIEKSLANTFIGYRVKCQPNLMKTPNMHYFINIDCDAGRYIANVNGNIHENGNLETVVLIQDMQTSERAFFTHWFRLTPNVKEVSVSQAFDNQMIHQQLTPMGWKEMKSKIVKHPQIDETFSIFYMNFLMHS